MLVLSDIARLAAVGIFLTAMPTADPPALDAEVERHSILMGTVARLVVVGESREQSLQATRDIEDVLREAEDELSTWRKGTDLDRLNRAPVGSSVTVSPELDAELSRALACAELTRGAFDPTLGALIQAWDLRGDGRRPSPGELDEALRLTGSHWLERVEAGWLRRQNVIVDEGGFGKGAALDRLRRHLADGPPRRVLVDLGGQMLLSDPRPDAVPWSIAVADPDDRSTPVLLLSLPDGSVATSSNSERSVSATISADPKSPAEKIGHLLDPRTGRPARDFGSMTVWAPTGLEADCLATGLFVAGPEAALELARERDGIEVVVIERTADRLHVSVSDGMRGRVEVISDRVSLLSQEPPKKSAFRGSSTGSAGPRR